MPELAVPAPYLGWLEEGGQDLGELLSRPVEPVRWQVEGLWERGDVVVLAAPPSHGKTFLAMQLALAVATNGVAWGRFPVRQPGRVAYFNLEMSERRMARNFARLRDGHCSDSSGLSAVRVWTGSGCSLDDPDEADAIAAAIVRFAASVDLIVFDTLRRCLGGDEQDSGAMARLFASARNVSRELDGPTILFLHHFRKNGQNDRSEIADRLRGSGDILAAADHVFAVTTREGGRHRLVTVKSRERDADPMVIRFEGWSDNPNDDAGAIVPLQLIAEDEFESALADGHKIEAAIIRFLQPRPHRAALRQEIIAALAGEGVAQSRAASQALSALKVKGEIDSRGGRGVPTTYYMITGGEGLDALL